MPRSWIPRTGLRGLAVPALAAAAALSVMFHAPDARAQWVSTAELVDNYCDSDNPEEAAFCVGYMAGSLHVLMAPPELFPRGMFCMDVERQPKLTSLAEQLIRLRKEHEDLARTPAYTLIAGILERNFPCPDEMLEELQQSATPAPAPAPGNEAAPPSEVFGLDD